ncbi:MAG: hypothetical protein KDJ99_31250 [Candidatus Competibacteraceae bacterium]|nr:hypothetical protein [Candidatus Competibacteraceae bacterium]
MPLKVLVVCFNRALTPYLKQAIWNCFDARKPVKDWTLSHHDVEVINIDRLAWRLGREIGFKYDPRQPIAPQVQALMRTPACQTYDHIFIDEGQDIDLDWYPLLRTLAKPLPEVGPSIIVFYDEAQNLYGVKRPGVGDIPSWKEFLGETPNPRGLRTVMRVGHRNTNEILTFSFNMLLGAFSERDPRMKEFANLNDFETTHRIPDDDPTMNHPNAGKPCVEKINPESSDRFYKTNFAIHKGPKPLIHKFDDDEALLVKLQKTIIASLDPNQANVDPKDILVMAPDLNGVSKIKEAFTDIGIDWHSPHGKFDGRDLRDQPFFQEGKITISTIKSAKGYTAHVVHLVFVDRLIPSEDTSLEREQQARAMFHVACTRATLSVEIWGQDCALLQEAQQVLAAM